MKKAALTLAALATVSFAVPAAAQAAVTPTIHATGGNVQSSNDGVFQVGQDDSTYGSCIDGKATTNVAVRTTSGTKTLYLVYSDWSSGDQQLKQIAIPDVTSAGKIVPVPAGFGTLFAQDMGTNVADQYFVSETPDSDLTYAPATTDPGTLLMDAVDPTGNPTPEMDGSYTKCVDNYVGRQGLPTEWAAVPAPTKTTPPPSTSVPAPTKTSPSKTAPTKGTSAPAPVTSPTKSTGKTSTGTTPAPVSKPGMGTAPTGNASTPASPVQTPTGGMAPSTGSASTGSKAVTPAASSGSTAGPKIQTDLVKSSNNDTTDEAIAGLLALGLVTGGATMVARRRR